MSYRQLATRPLLDWALVAIGARFPVAMTPLALVFLVRERPGGYALGAGLAAAYVIGEVAGASVLGPRLNPERARFQLAAGLALGACSFAGLGLLPHAQPLVLGVTAILAGAGLTLLLTAASAAGELSSQPLRCLRRRRTHPPARAFNSVLKEVDFTAVHLAS